jgi:hypothetical protein
MDPCSQYANAQNCTPSHTLPFTGMDVFLVIGLAVVLLTLGLLIRYSERRA